MKVVKKVIYVAMASFCLNLTVSSQNITLKMSNITVKQAMDELKSRSGYSFVFSSADVDTGKKISVSSENQSINAVIEQILRGQGLTYEIQGKNIILKKVNVSDQQVPKKNITGSVLDVDGDAIIGANIVVKGTTNGTITDLNGHFSISDVSSNAVLVLSYIGYKDKEIHVNNQSDFKIVLNEDTQALEEVVVVGYGTQKKAHLTGSVATVSQKDMLKTTASNMSQTLVGKLPGLITQQSLGQPGSDDVSILIRGYSSFSGSGTVLVLVDGVERAMGQVDPNDVESVTILKDAASCAVYGMKAANGVVLVTTKHGQEGKTDITYRGSMTLSHATTLPKMMNGTQYMQWYNLARKLDNNGVDNPYFTDEEIAATYNGDPTDGFENTDWTSDLYKTTLMHQHNLSINGGSNKVRYFISGGYLHQDGIIKGNKNERSNFRSNIDVQATKDIKVSLNTAALIKDYYQPGGYSYGNQQAYSIFHQLLYSIPFVPKEYEGYPTSAYRGATSAANPIYGSANSGFQESRRVSPIPERFESKYVHQLGLARPGK